MTDVETGYGAPSASDPGRGTERESSHHSREIALFYSPLSNINYSGVRNYQSQAEDNSLLYNFLFSPVLGFVVMYLVPRRLHPNLITLSGLLFLLIALGINVFFAPTLTEVMPEWVYVAVAGLLFSATCLDIMDGKQARLTGKASAVGEILDHSVDCVATGVFALCAGSALQAGPYWSALLLVAAQVAVYSKHWETCVTHKLVLDRITGPLEFELLAIATVGTGHLLADFHGFEFWTVDTRHETTGELTQHFRMQISHIFILALSSFAGIAFLRALWTVYDRLYWKEMPMDSRATQTLKRMLIYWVVPLGLLVLWFAVWVLAVDTGGFQQLPWVTMLAEVASFSVICTRVIVDRIAEKPFQVLFLPHFFTIVLGFAAWATENYAFENFAAVLMFLLSAATYVVYLKFNLGVLCEILKIRFI